MFPSLDVAVCIKEVGVLLLVHHSLGSATRELLEAGATLVHAGAIADGKQLTLPVTVGGISGVGVLDTGARGTIINPKFEPKPAGHGQWHERLRLNSTLESRRLASRTPRLQKAGDRLSARRARVRLLHSYMSRM
jgi:hypothetical protein